MSDQNPPPDPSSYDPAAPPPPTWDAPPPPPAPAWDAPSSPDAPPAPAWDAPPSTTDAPAAQTWAPPPPPTSTYSPAQPAYGAPGVPPGYVQKQKMVAGLLGILLGSFGIHNFYLGNTNKGIIQIVVTIVTCGIGGLWGFIEGIMILTGSINTDANGVPLAE